MAATFDAGRTEGGGWAESWRNLRVATLLGWRIESNWTDPVLFFIYTVAKPIASMLLLVVMLDIIGGAGSEALRTFVVVGSALWATVVSGIAGSAWSVLDDRERYRMLKYVYVSPASFLLVLVGRGLARLAAGAMGTVVAFVFAVAVLGLRLDLAAIDWPMLLASLALGLPVVIVLGVLLAAVCLQSRQESWRYPDAVAGALFLVTGTVFPLAVLPDPVEWVGLLNPVTWWVAGVRAGLDPAAPSSIGGDGSVWTAVTGTVAPDPATVLIALLATGAAGTLAAIVLFRASERRARDRGLLDQTSGS